MVTSEPLILRLSRSEKAALWRAVRPLTYLRPGWTSPRFKEADTNPIQALAKKFSKKQRWFRERVQSEITKVAGVAGDALIIRNLLYLPRTEFLGVREDIRANPLAKHSAYRVEHLLRFLLGSADLLALPEYYENGPVHVNDPIGEEWDAQYRTAKHKLSADAATVHPNRPFGVGLFGEEKGGRLDTVSPDVVAYIMIDKVNLIEDAGPILIHIDDLTEQLRAVAGTNDVVSELQRPEFRIEPDQGLTRSYTQDYGFGGVEKINILGLKDGMHSYMRFIAGRTSHIDTTKHWPTKTLDEALLACESRGRWANKRFPGLQLGINLRRGDVLLVNNRRVATRWKNKCARFESWWSRNVEGEPPAYSPLRPRNRSVLRMLFYLTRDIRS